MAVAYNATGNNSTGTLFGASNGSSMSWSHTASGSDRCVVVGVIGYRSATRQINVSVTYGGNAMTSMGQLMTNNVAANAGTAGFVWLFYLMNPPTGAQTVQATWAAVGGTSTLWFDGNSTSYTGVVDVGGLVNNSGAAAGTSLSSGSISSPTDGFIAQLFGALQLASIGSYSGNSREAMTPSSTFISGVLGDLAGDGTSKTLTATRSSGVDWASTAVLLYPLDPKTVTPTAGSLTLTGQTPTVTVSNNIRVAPTAAALTLTGQAAGLLLPKLIAPTAAALTLTGQAAGLLLPKLIAPTAAALTLTTFGPSVLIGDQIVITPAQASLALTGQTPTVTVTEHKTITPTVATLTLTGQTPYVVIPLRIAPTAAVLTITRMTPNVEIGNTVAVFTSGTVLTLEGLNPDHNDYMGTILQAHFSNSPYTRQIIPYPASTSSKSISTGVKNLDAAVRAVAGPKIVLCHSMGSQVAAHWMDEHADDETAPDSSELMFILTGNPLRATGGHGIGLPEFGGTTGEATRTDTQWKVIDMARRYDGHADWPTDETNSIAVRNAFSGMFAGNHVYENADLFDTNNTVWTIGNTTFVLTQEDPPLMKYYILIGAEGARVKAKTKKKIEAGYNNRPVTDPPIVSPEPNWFWKSILGRMGIDIS